MSILDKFCPAEIDSDLENGYASLRDGDYAGALELFGRSPSPEADYCIAFMNLHGVGIEKNPEAGVDMLEKCVESGFLPAISDLAQCYGYGIGRDVDDSKAFELFSKASESGDPYGMLMLSFMYHTGEGTKKDRAKSELWCSRCESFREAEEFEDGGFDYLDTADYIRARILLMRSAAAGSPISAKALEIMFREGIGVSKDFEEAQDWADTAADCGWNELTSEDLGDYAEWFSSHIDLPGN